VRAKPSISAGLIAWLCLGATMALLGLVTASPLHSDFGIIYRSAGALLGGAPAYDIPNLNPPIVSLVLAPIFALPLSAAWIVWIAAGGLGIGLSLAIARRTGVVDATAMLWSLGACGALAGSSMAWHLGQITWILLPLVTAAWADARRQRHLRAGIWLGIAIGFKPPLILAAACLPLTIAATASITAGAIVGLAASVTGIAPWLAWLKLGRTITWIGQPMNASLWGVAARVESWRSVGFGISDFGPATVIVIVGVTAVMIWRARRADLDDRWTLALIVSTAASPLGWTYYAPLALFPCAASWRRTGAIAVGLLCLPLPFPWISRPNGDFSTVLVGLLYPTGFAIAWFAWSSPLYRRRAIGLRGLDASAARIGDA
jgi:alpha-1,2-mannosyltransferase